MGNGGRGLVLVVIINGISPHLQSISLVSSFSLSHVVCKPEQPPCCSMMCSFCFVNVLFLFMPLPHELDHEDHTL